MGIGVDLVGSSIWSGQVRWTVTSVAEADALTEVRHAVG
jgi:hypothetical protein